MDPLWDISADVKPSSPRVHIDLSVATEHISLEKGARASILLGGSIVIATVGERCRGDLCHRER